MGKVVVREADGASERLQSVFDHCLAITVVAPLEPEQRSITDVPDVFVSKLDEIFRHLIGADNIIGTNLVYRLTVPVRDEIVSQQDVRNAQLFQGIHEAVIVGARQYHTVCNAVAPQHARQPQVARTDFRRVVELREEDEVPNLLAVFFHALEDAGVHWVEEVAIAQDEGEDRRRITNETPCSGIGPVVQLLDRLLHAQPQARVHVGMAVDDTGGRSQGHVRALRYVFQGYAQWTACPVMKHFNT